MVWIVAYSQNTRLQNVENSNLNLGTDPEEQNRDFKVNIIKIRHKKNNSLKYVFEKSIQPRCEFKF
jgi:hypothetical protein